MESEPLDLNRKILIFALDLIEFSASFALDLKKYV